MNWKELNVHIKAICEGFGVDFTTVTGINTVAGDDVVFTVVGECGHIYEVSKEVK